MAKFNLQERERRVLMFGGIAVALIVGYLVGQGPWQEYTASAQKLERARENLRNAQAVERQVLRSREEEAILRERVAVAQGFDLLTFVNNAVREGGLNTRASIDNTQRGVTGSEELASVRLELRGISLNELIDFLHRVYNSGNPVVLHQLDQLAPALDQKGLDCAMVLVAPRA